MSLHRLLPLFLVFLCATSTLAARPNVILIMTDDQGYGDVAFHGNKMIQTPNLDRLAKESIRFTNFHVDPTCSETRSALMTGRYSCRAGVWHTIMGRSLLHNREITMAQVFQASGYRTGIFGKWHLGDNYPLRPQDRGFQESLVCGGGGVGQTPDYWRNDYFDDTYFHNGKPQKQTGYCTDVFFRAAQEFIRTNKDRPFFCYIPTNAPHGPFLVDKKYSDPYVKQGVHPTMAKFYGMITNIDENVGQLRKTLRQTGLDKKTLLIFMTDNGTAAGVLGRPRNRRKRIPNIKWKGFNAGMRGRKGSQYDGGHRVPCFIHHAGLSIRQGGREIDHLAAHFDLLPTLIDLCDLKKPANKLDGQSHAAVLKGANVKRTARTLVVHSQRVDYPRKYRKCSVMTQRWRLINGQQLFDMTRDPGQQRNVAAAHPDVVRRLRAFYDRWWADVSKGFDDYTRIVLGAAGVKHPRELTCHDWHTARVPWHQSMVARNQRANGYWAVQVARAGRYKITLRARPKHVSYKFEGGQATVEIGGQTASAQVPKGANSIALFVQLRAGNARLKTTIEEPRRGARGAYFVSVERVGNGKPQPHKPAVKTSGSGFRFRQGDRVTWIGGTNIERRQAYGYLESVITSAYPRLGLRFRNLGWSGDDVHGLARAVFGTPAKGYQRLIDDLKATRPTVVMIEYGNNEAHAGPAGLERFQNGLKRLLGEIGKLKARPVIWLPRDYETLGAPLPSPTKYNQKVSAYRDWLRRFCQQEQIPCLKFFVPYRDGQRQFDSQKRLVIPTTSNGMHLTEFGHWHTASSAARALGIAKSKVWHVSLRVGSTQAMVGGTKLANVAVTDTKVVFEAQDDRLPLPRFTGSRHRTADNYGQLRVTGLKAGRYWLKLNGRRHRRLTGQQLARGIHIGRPALLQADQLRKLIVRKNEFVFHRYRPQNETYLFLFRKHEQGNNAKEVFEFGKHITALEKQIAAYAAPKTYRFEIVRIP